MKTDAKEFVSYFIAAFIIWGVLQVIFDLITGMSFTDMASIRYIVIQSVSTAGFAFIFTLFLIRERRSKKK